MCLDEAGVELMAKLSSSSGHSSSEEKAWGLWPVTVREVTKARLELTQPGKGWWGQGEDGLCPAGLWD